MIMTDKFADTMAQMLLAQRDYPAEAFLFDRSDKSLAVGTQVRTPRWHSEYLYASRTQNTPE